MGVNSNAKRKYENAMPLPDESWWESVLAEERRYSSSSPRLKEAVPPVTPDPDPKTQVSNQLVLRGDIDWEHAMNLFHDDRILAVKVVGHNRGGLLVEGDGLSGFVPFSHLVELAAKSDTADRDTGLAAYMNKVLEVKVIECVPEEARIIFSERAALSKPGRRSELFHHLAPGARVRGTVTNITDFGVFVDLGGAEGLIHISELSWGRVVHPNQIVKLGEQVEVQVLDLSVERCRVGLSLKRMFDNPWKRASTDFAEGCILPAEITTVLSYGAFARLEVGVEGLIHATEMPLGAGQTPHDILKVGQQVQVRVLHVDPAHQRMGLALQIDS